MKPRPLRVLMLTTSYPLRKGSRSGIFIQRMVEQLPAGIAVTVLTPDDSAAAAGCVPTERCAIIPFRYAPKAWQRLAHGSGGIAAALARSAWNLLLLPPMLCSCLVMTCWHGRKADVLHANWSLNGAVAGIAGLLFNKPVITTLRGSDVNLAEQSWVMRQLAGSCLSQSRFVVTVSPALKQALARQFPRYADKIRVIANGIDQAFFAAGEKRSGGSLVRFLYAGNLVPGKGVQVILEAAAMLSADHWQLDIVGDGPEREHLTAFCQAKGLHDKVRLHGPAAPEQMPEIMGRADVFVFASFAEGRPNVVIEAMAAGLPVLAAAIPAVLELIEDGREGLLFPPGDADDLAGHMQYCLCHPAGRQKMGENARERLRALGLSWQETAARCAALYEAAVRTS